MEPILDSRQVGLTDTATDQLYDTSSSAGSQAAFVNRIRPLLPWNWFPQPPASGEAEEAPVLVGMLNGFGNIFSGLWSLFTQVSGGTRLSTCSGTLLDLASVDLFGLGDFPRLAGETDASFLARIKAELFAKKNTDDAVRSALVAAGVPVPLITECWNAADCGHYSDGKTGGSPGGYGQGLIHWSGQPGQVFIELGDVSTDVQEAAVKALKRTKAMGVIAWYR